MCVQHGHNWPNVLPFVDWLVGWLISSVTINDSPTYKYRSVIYMNLITITSNKGRKKFKLIKISLSKNGLELEASLKQMSARCRSSVRQQLTAT